MHLLCLWLHIGIVAPLSARGNYSPLMLGLLPQTQTVDDILLRLEKVFAYLRELARDQCGIPWWILFVLGYRSVGAGVGKEGARSSWQT